MNELPSIYHSQNGETTKIENRLVVAKEQEWDGDWVQLQMGSTVSFFVVMKQF